ncbi:MAG: GNAT family N-acetyltransferase [Planctomycetota bacterium]
MTTAWSFSSERLRARPMAHGDEPAMRQVYGDPVSMRFVGDGTPITDAEIALWIERTRGNFLTRGYGMWALVERSSGATVGFMGIVHPGDPPADEPELKYAFLRSRWGEGLATEAGRACVEHARADLGLERLIATTDPEHVVSHRVLARLGFTGAPSRFDEDGETRVFELLLGRD